MRCRIVLLALVALNLTAHATTATVTKTVKWARELWEPRVYVTRHWSVGWWEDYRTHDDHWDMDFDHQVLKLVEKTSQCTYFEYKQECSEPVTTTWTSYETTWDKGNVPPGGDISNHLNAFCNGANGWDVPRNKREDVPYGVNGDQEAERYFGETGNTLQIYVGPEAHGPEIYPPGVWRFGSFGEPQIKKVYPFTDTAGNKGFLCMEITATPNPQFTISRK